MTASAVDTASLAVASSHHRMSSKGAQKHKKPSFFKRFSSRGKVDPSIGASSSTPSSSGVNPAATSVQQTNTISRANVADVTLNNVAAAARIGKDVAETFGHLPYLKTITGAAAQIIKIYEVCASSNLLIDM